MDKAKEIKPKRSKRRYYTASFNQLYRIEDEDDYSVMIRFDGKEYQVLNVRDMCFRYKDVLEGLDESILNEITKEEAGQMIMEEIDSYVRAGKQLIKKL